MPDRVIHLEPLNGTFERKVLNLVAAPVKIGRSVNERDNTWDRRHGLMIVGS